MLDAIQKARHPVALTGAGISAPSGVPTYQSQWKGRPIRDFLGRDYFRRDPVGFFELYCAMEAWCHAEPNPAHLSLAENGVRVVTQNIDGLHQKAGSAQVIELHGNLRNILCPACGKVSPAKPLCGALRPLYAAGNRDAIAKALHCACGSPLDMDVVLYDDPVRDFERAVDWLMEADLLLVIGTALETYPAAAMPGIARERGTRVMIENNDCVSALAEREST